MCSAELEQGKLSRVSLKKLLALFDHLQMQGIVGRTRVPLARIARLTNSLNIGRQIRWLVGVNNVQSNVSQPMPHFSEWMEAIRARVVVGMLKFVRNKRDFPAEVFYKLNWRQIVFFGMVINRISSLDYPTVRPLPFVPRFLFAHGAVDSAVKNFRVASNSNFLTSIKPFFRCPKPTLLTNLFHTHIIPQLST